MKALEKETLFRAHMKEKGRVRREVRRAEAEADAARWRTEAERRQARIDNAVTRGLGMLPKPRRFRGYTPDEVHNAVTVAAAAAV
ncbi:MAG: hypothetical protein KDB26_08555 [Microthrixaceae bacterium]|nr:hypothetical protein [Microthrixaceae bacterium]